MGAATVDSLEEQGEDLDKRQTLLKTMIVRVTEYEFL